MISQFRDFVRKHLILRFFFGSTFIPALFGLFGFFATKNLTLKTILATLFIINVLFAVDEEIEYQKLRRYKEFPPEDNDEGGVTITGKEKLQ